MKANINWLTETLATGGDLSPIPAVANAQIEDIKAQDIALIVDLRMEANDTDIWEAHGVDYLHLPTDDAWGHHIPAQLFHDLVAAALPVVLDGDKVLVHCHMGINRGPSGAFALLLAMGMDAVEAWDLIRKERPQAMIAYATDAMVAHQERLVRDRFGGSAKELARDNADKFAALDKHIRTRMTRAEERKIEHIIRKNHEDDARAWRQALLEQDFASNP